VSQFFDPVLHIAATAIDAVNSFGFERKVRYDVPVVVANRTIRKADDFSFYTQTARLRPGFRLISEIGEKLFSGSDRQNSDNCPHKRLNLGFQSGIACKSHQIFDPFKFQVVEDVWG